MAVKIRLARRGRKRQAIYSIVAADQRAPRDGRFIKKLGTYNPNTAPSTVEIDEASTLHYLLCGATPTATVKNMLSRKGLLLKKHLQLGVRKGAITEAEAEKRFEQWQKSKQAAPTHAAAPKKGEKTTPSPTAAPAE